MARYDPEIEEEATTDVPRTKLSSIDLYQQGLLKNRVDILGKGSFIFVLWDSKTPFKLYVSIRIAIFNFILRKT